MSDKFNVMATVRYQEVAGYSDTNEPIYKATYRDQIWLEGFTSKAEAQKYANEALRNPLIRLAWVQSASTPFVDPVRKAQAITSQQTQSIKRSR